MSPTREPMDDLDVKFAREAATLREYIEASASTDGAWAEFEATRAGAVSLAVPSRDGRRRWMVTAAVGLAAALLATLVLVRVAEEKSPTIRPADPTPTSPTPDLPAPPITQAGARDAATVARVNGDLVAIDQNGNEQVIGRLPAAVLQSLAQESIGGEVRYLHADVSSAGWVAVTGFVSEGFWFFDLDDPSLAARWVDLVGRPGGFTSAGTWNPEGTLYAAVELGTTAVIIDPATGVLSRLVSVDPPIGYPPTWTADGSGILTGEDVRCDGALPNAQRRLTIVPIDGGPERASIPELANGLDGVSEGGVWATDNRCAAGSGGTPDPMSRPSGVVVASSPSGVETWVDAAEIEPEVLRDSVFATTRPALWVLTTEEGTPARMLLHEVSRQSDRVVNAAPFDSAGLQSEFIIGVAPDESAVVVLVNGPEDRRKLYLVPTDGSPALEFDGEFAGFVPRPMVDRLAASGSATTSPDGTDPRSPTTVPSAAALTPAGDLPTTSGLQLPLFPDDRQITSISATSDTEFWVLSDWPSGGQPLLWHTVDGGASWTDVAFQPDPLEILADPEGACLSCFGPIGPDGHASPGSVYFVDARNGYLVFGADASVDGAKGGIFSTNDGGRTWSLSQRSVMLGPSGGSWDSVRREEDDAAGIASDGATVYVIANADRDGSSGATKIVSSPVGSARFTDSGPLLGRYWMAPNSNQLVVAGDTGWAVTFGTLDGGARLVDGQWVEWSPPCAISPAALETGFTPVPRVRLDASSDGSALVVLCAPVPTSAGSDSVEVFVSHDGGNTFDERNRSLSGILTGQSWVHVTDGGTTIVGTTLDTGDFVIQRSTDDGRSWQLVATLGMSVSRTEVDALPGGRIMVFATATDETGGPTHVAVVSDDEGMTWQSVPFA
jgi:hypothetical protein